MSNMNDIHNSEQRYEQNRQKLQQSEKVSSENKEAIKRFVQKSLARDVSKARARKYLTDFHSMLQLVDDFTLLDAEEEDLERLVAEINAADYAEATKSDFKYVLLKFYKIMEGDGELPDKTEFIDPEEDKSKREDPDILTRDEVDQIIQACKNDRDRAMYKLLYEAGLRAGELISLQIKDLNFTENGVKVTVNGKTGERRPLVVESERYLRNWLSKHPFSDRRNAPLWVKVDGNNIDEETPEDMKIGYDYMRINLKRKARDAGVRPTTNSSGRETSEVYPHLFRHTRATHLATEMTEATMKKYFGWWEGSDMPKTYIHLSGHDVDQEVMDIYGLETEKDEPEEKTCPKCTRKYKGRDSYCPRCGAPLEFSSAMDRTEAIEEADVLANALVDGEITREYLKMV